MSNVVSPSTLKPSPSKKRSRDRRGTTGSADERNRSSSHGDTAASGRVDAVSDVGDQQERFALQNGRLSHRRSHVESGSRGLLQRQEAAGGDTAAGLFPQPYREKKVERLFAATQESGRGQTEQDLAASSSITVSRHLIKVGRSISGEDTSEMVMTRNRKDNKIIIRKEDKIDNYFLPVVKTELKNH